MSLYENCSTVSRRRADIPWYVKAVIITALLTLVTLIGGMSYLVKAKYAMNDYVIHLGAAFNAATIVNATENHVEEDKAVISEYNGQRVVLVPENYKPLQSYLRRDYAMPLFGYVNRDNALHVSICGESHLYIVGDADGQGATLAFDCADETFVMHVTGGDLWQKLIDICMKGFGKNANIPL